MFLQSIGTRALIGAVLLALATSWLAISANAATIIGSSVKLSTLANNPQGMLVVGDKKFTNFTYEFTGDMPAAVGVNVIPIQDDDGNFGIRFQGLFIDVASSVGGSDALITYDVETTDPLKLISDAHLRGNLVLPVPAPPATGRHGVITITETFFPLGLNGEYTMTIFDDEGAPQPKLADWVYFSPPVKKLSVQKDIGILAIAGFPSPNFSFVDQTFSQVTVPEPATLLMSMVGLALLAVHSRRPLTRRG